MSGYLPVPTMSRDWNVRPPMVSGSSRMVSTAVVIVSPSADEMNEFDGVSCIHRHAAQPRPPHDLPIVLHNHRSRIELELDPRAVVVEHNRKIVRRAGLGGVTVNAGDAIELVHFVGGG